MSYQNQLDFQKKYEQKYQSFEAIAYREAIERCQFELQELQNRLLDTKTNYGAFLTGKTPKLLPPLVILDIKSTQIKEQVLIDNAFLELKQKIANSQNKFWAKILDKIRKLCYN